jgi:hypothetical protein
MRTRLVVSVAASVLLLVAPLPLAVAARLTISDPAGDTFVPGLDIVRAKFANNQHTLVMTVHFVRDRPSVVLVGVKPRGLAPVAVVSRHRAQGRDVSRLVNPRGRAMKCSSLTTYWNRTSATIRVRILSKCIHDGDFGPVRFWAVTERFGNGGDIDYAPQTAGGDFRRTRWIPREQSSKSCLRSGMLAVWSDPRLASRKSATMRC